MIHFAFTVKPWRLKKGWGKSATLCAGNPLFNIWQELRQLKMERYVWTGSTGSWTCGCSSSSAFLWSLVMGPNGNFFSRDPKSLAAPPPLTNGMWQPGKTQTLGSLREGESGSVSRSTTARDEAIQHRWPGDSAFNNPLMMMCCRCASLAENIDRPRPLGAKGIN